MNILKVFKIIIVIVLLLSLAAAVFIFVWQGVYIPKNPTDIENKVFTVRKGEGLFQIADNLEREGFIKNKFFFDLYVFLIKSQGKLQAGHYYFSSSMEVAQIAGIMITGETIKETITIPEGWNIRDIGQYLEERGLLRKEDFYKVVGFPAADYARSGELPFPVDFSPDYGFLAGKTDRVGLEGFLFPDTYEIREHDAEEIVRKMLDNLQAKLSPDIMEEIKNQKKSVFEIITMASLLEKEVRTADDKEIVSGILWKRLENDFPLQVDSTITYITGQKSTTVSKAETQIDSPFNTYKYPGLPLGPICNPGVESIIAALYPKSSDYWYYLSSPEGQTIFSVTLADHNAAKDMHLR
jgi:UPF0755 protein